LAVIVAVLVIAPSLPVIVADVAPKTGGVVTVKVADVAPARIVTVAGTVKELLLELSVTVRPPLGAGELIVAVPIEGVPPVTEVGLKVMPNTFTGLMVSRAVRVVAFFVAEIVAVVVEATVSVE
jgi:hypothetical protein